jgi:hypothetical protein
MKAPESDIRRENLKRLILERFEGNRAAFCRAAYKNPNMINLILSSNPDLQRSFGEKVARDIERVLNLPDKWLDAVQSGAQIGAVYNIPVVRLDQLNAAGVERLILGVDIVSRHLDRPTAMTNVRACYMPTQEMAPAIGQDDLMLIDSGVSEIDRDGVFVITRGTDVFVRRVRRLLAGGIRISADSSPDTLDAQPGQFACAGRIVGLLKFSAP